MPLAVSTNSQYQAFNPSQNRNSGGTAGTGSSAPSTSDSAMGSGSVQSAGGSVSLDPTFANMLTALAPSQGTNVGTSGIDDGESGAAPQAIMSGVVPSLAPASAASESATATGGLSSLLASLTPDSAPSTTTASPATVSAGNAPSGSIPADLGRFGSLLTSLAADLCGSPDLTTTAPASGVSSTTSRSGMVDMSAASLSTSNVTTSAAASGSSPGTILAADLDQLGSLLTLLDAKLDGSSDASSSAPSSASIVPPPTPQPFGPLNASPDLSPMPNA